MDRKENKTSADTPENEPKKANAAPGPVTAFQDKMEKWTDMVGYGAYRGLICGLFSALGLDIVLVIVRVSQAVLTHSFGKQDTATLGEMLVNSFFFVVGLTIFVTPVGVIIGAILGAAGIIRKKKRPSEPEKPESN
jgi:ABC-type phosphate transport system permease subunit